MKKILIISIFLVFSGSIFAQSFPIDLGPKIGFNTSRLTTQLRDYTHDIKNGWHGGLFFRFGVGKFYFQPEAFIAIKNTGMSYEYDSFDPGNPTSLDPVTQTLKLTTLDVPLLMGFKLLDLRVANLRVFGGPVASFELNKELSLRIGNIDQSNKISSEDFNNAAWSFKIGAGFDVMVVTVDISYEWGIDKLYQINEIPDMVGRTNIFYITVGWKVL